MKNSIKWLANKRGFMKPTEMPRKRDTKRIRQETLSQPQAIPARSPGSMPVNLLHSLLPE